MADVHEHVVVEKSGGSGMTAIIALLVVAIIAIAAYFLVTSQTHKDNAVAGAAQSVSHAADKVGGAVDSPSAN